MTKRKPKHKPAPQPHRKGPWSHRELEIIKQFYGKMSEQSLARRLNRPLPSLRARLKRIYDDPARRTGPWLPSELAELRELLGRAQVAVIARRLRRSPLDVAQRIEQLQRRIREHPWTSDEKQRLKRDYGSRSDYDLALILGQPVEAIRRMAEELRLAKDKTFLHRAEGVEHVRMPRWSAEQIERLRAMYPVHSNEEIARAIGRSVKAVVSKANDLELKKSSERLREMGRENVRLRHERERGAATEEPGAD